MRRAVERGASDLHLVPGYPPVLRVHGTLEQIDELPLAGGDTEALFRQICPEAMRADFADSTDEDFSYVLDEVDVAARFRVNVFLAGGHRGACFRLIPPRIPDFGWAEFSPQLAQRLAYLRDGLVIVTGPTGSGKTTTLAMIVELLNQTGGRRILTVEQPVEYVFSRSQSSIVTQREVGTDVPTFADGLKFGLRQDPDVILVGEIRDRETAQMALSAAETGHLVFTTLHTRDAKGMVTRLADLFPQESQKDIRSQLAMSLRAVVSQRLLPDVEPGNKRHLALEILWNSHPIANAIRTGKVESIDNYLLTRRDEGMVSFDDSVRRLYQEDKITRSTAEQNLTDPTALNRP
jgi:twitching motility protein PilT